MRVISYSLLTMLAIAYFVSAFIMMISEGLDGQPTIYNFIGLAMFALPVLIYNLKK